MARRSRAQTSRRTGQGSRRASAADDTAADGGFPLVVAALSTITALALFFTATVPALQESRDLNQVEVEQQQVHTNLWRELDNASKTQMALRVDVQSMMVELDRHGIYAGEVLDPLAGEDAGSEAAKTVHTAGGATVDRNPGSRPGDRR